MKATIPLLCLVLLLAGSEAAIIQSSFVGTNTYNQRYMNYYSTQYQSGCHLPFNEYILRYGKFYPTPVHYAYRRSIYEENCAKIQLQNSLGLRNYKLTITKFSDLTEREFDMMYLSARFNLATEKYHGQHHRKQNKRRRRRLQEQEDYSSDWDDEGYVTPVRDQGFCGSCWAFTSSAVIESNLLIFSDKPYNVNTLHVSEQQQVDCVYSSPGCDGGTSEDSYQYAMQKGITRAGYYPYTGRDGACKWEGGQYKIYDYEHYLMTCEQLKEELYYGPISVGVNADDWDQIGDNIFPYQSATFDDINHAVALVGFQEAFGDEPAYWIIKNSWGRDWGDQGFAYLEYGPDGNSFGICLDTAFPLIQPYEDEVDDNQNNDGDNGDDGNDGDDDGDGDDGDNDQNNDGDDGDDDGNGDDDGDNQNNDDDDQNNDDDDGDNDGGDDDGDNDGDDDDQNNNDDGGDQNNDEGNDNEDGDDGDNEENDEDGDDEDDDDDV